MIKYLKLKDHKALNQVDLHSLGRINIFCGKNNSGKTTLLESMCDTNKVGLGKELIGTRDWLISLFSPFAEKYNRPTPNMSKRWFSEYLDKEIDQNVKWYSDEKEIIQQHIIDSQKSFPALQNVNSNIYNFNAILSSFFKKSLDFFQPILIPPKRSLYFKSEIDFNQEISPGGEGLINKLFYLKNQDLESDAYRTYKQIYDTFTYITNSKFNVIPNTDNQIELFYQADTDWINAEACGLGLTDVLIIVTVLNVFDNNVILIEEPENHLHADFQKRLLSYFTSIKTKQFFISTHSSIFINTDIIDKVYYCENNGEITVSDQTTKSEIITSLGYSFTDNLVADLIILSEGPTDIPVIKEMLSWVGLGVHHNIKFWPLGGDIMASLDLSVFAERKNVFALIDSDPGSSVQRTRFARNCKAN